MGQIRPRSLPPLSTLLPVASFIALAAVLVLSATVPEESGTEGAAGDAAPVEEPAPTPTTAASEGDEVAVAGIMIDLSMMDTRRDQPGGLDARTGGGWASTDPPPSAAAPDPQPVSVATPSAGAPPVAAPPPATEPPPVPGVGRPVTGSGSGAGDGGDSGDTVVASSG